MSRQALEMALEALNHYEKAGLATVKTIDAITAIKEVLAQPEQEPVGQLLEDAFGRGQVMWFNKPKDESMFYTTPPQRKPLMDEEIDRIWVPHSIIQAPDRQRQAFARAIEAAHGIKE